MKKITCSKKSMKALQKKLVKVANSFAVLPCVGPWYEPKVPEKLKK